MPLPAHVKVFPMTYLGNADLTQMVICTRKEMEYLERSEQEYQIFLKQYDHEFFEYYIKKRVTEGDQWGRIFQAGEQGSLYEDAEVYASTSCYCVLDPLCEQTTVTPRPTGI